MEKQITSKDLSLYLIVFYDAHALRARFVGGKMNTVSDGRVMIEIQVDQFTTTRIITLSVES